MAIPEHKSKWKTLGLDDLYNDIKIRYMTDTYTYRRKERLQVKYRVYNSHGVIVEDYAEDLPNDMSEHDIVKLIIENTVGDLKYRYVGNVAHLKELYYANEHDLNDPAVREEYETNGHDIIESMDIGEKIDDWSF